MWLSTAASSILLVLSLHSTSFETTSSQISHWSLILLVSLFALAMLGFLVCVNEGSTPFKPEWEEKLEGHRLKQVVGYFFAFAAFGAVVCLGVTLLASPMLLFKFV